MHMTCFNKPKNPKHVHDDEPCPMYPNVICFRPDQITLNDKFLQIIQASASVPTACTRSSSRRSTGPRWRARSRSA